MFVLTREETEQISRSQIVTLNENEGAGHNIKYLPHAFTEQGIYMLMTVLKGPLAVKQSQELIRTFKAMKDYIIENQNLIDQRQLIQLSMIATQNKSDIVAMGQNLKAVEDKMAEVVGELGEVVKKSDIAGVMVDFGNPHVRKGVLMLKGQPVEADLGYSQIYDHAKKSIFVIDNYIGLKTLVLMKAVPASVNVTIFSDNLMGGLHRLEYEDFHKEYPQVRVEFKKTCGEFHDRYIVLDYGTKDEIIYHCGGSSKDGGQRITTVEEIREKDEYHNLINRIMNNPELKLK
jgi:hypothetical protein